MRKPNNATCWAFGIVFLVIGFLIILVGWSLKASQAADVSSRAADLRSATAIRLLEVNQAKQNGTLGRISDNIKNVADRLERIDNRQSVMEQEIRRLHTN